MSATTETKKHARKYKKRYRLVEFESEIFEGVLRLPDTSQMPVKIFSALNRGDIDSLIEWCVAAGATREDAEVINELDNEEMKIFISEWDKGDLLPKSGE